MTLFLFIKQAFSSIWANKLRSFLSTLGIVIGISSFVIMLSIGEGAKQSILKQMGDSGNVINITKNGQSEIPSQKNIFTEETATEIQQKVPGIEKVVANYTTPMGSITYNSQSLNGYVKSISLDYLPFKKAEIQYGGYFSKAAFDQQKKFVIIGHSLITKDEWGTSASPLVGTIPIGQTIHIDGESFIIIGVLKEKGYDFDDKIFIPIPTHKKIFNSVYIESFELYAENEEIVERAQSYLKHFLLKKTGVEKGEDMPFSIQANKESLKQFNKMSEQFSLLLGGIGAIALIVGGIGIMNIMVVSVTERTREIGIRKAIGATNKNILLQFLIESIILTLLGSMIAILFSQGIVVLLGKMMPDFTPVINSYVLLIAVCVSVSMGVIFGLMPAYKAAKLKIIDALHFE